MSLLNRVVRINTVLSPKFMATAWICADRSANLSVVGAIAGRALAEWKRMV